MDEDLKRLIEETSAETRQQLTEVATSLRQENVETRNRVDTVAADLRRHFDVTAEDFRHQVQLVAEGVDNVNERVDRLAHDMKHEFAESRAMVQISYSDLDRRLRSLEERVERLESSHPQ
jgi:type I site-specific restriction-modification system R (restriction) subunit